MSSEAKRHLTYEERCQISSYLCNGFSQIEVAEQIGRDQSVICREVKRNSDDAGYDGEQAQKNAELRRSVASSRPKKLTDDVVMHIKDLLHEAEASPEQISGRLKKTAGIHVSHETIYKLIWADKHAGGVLYKHLRRQTKKYNKRSAKNAGRGLIPNRVDIDQRPQIVDLKTRLGDVELDTIVGANHKGAVVSIVDRATKYTWLSLVPQGTASNVEEAICTRLSSLSQQGLLHIYTSDNGKEFASHESIVERLGGDFYFAKPYHSWERGLNEHTNGLFRQYHPKGSDFTALSSDDVILVENKLNNRPRKVLDFLTPAEAMSNALLNRQDPRIDASD
jgi:IS30 family transposase